MTAPVSEVDVSPQAFEAIEEALRAFAKAFRAVQLYLPNNPTRTQSVDQARLAFARVWPHLSPLDLQVREASLLVDDRVVYQDLERATESLPWLLYRDGLRTLSVAAGFEDTDLDALLALLHRVRTATTDDDDLVTMLWVADLASVSYRYVEAGGSGDFSVSSGHGAGGSAGMPSDLPLTTTAADAPASGDTLQGVIRTEDFDSTLYFLEPREASYLQDELKREYTDDQRRLVLASLFDILDVQTDPEAQREAVGILGQLVLEFLTRGEYDLVAYLLREAASVAGQDAVDAQAAEGLRELPARLSEPHAVAQLLLGLDENSRAPVASLLEGLFAELRPTALETLVGWLGSAAASPARAAVERASLRMAGANTAELARMLEHPQDAIVRGALRLAAQLATPAAVPGLAKLLRGADVKLRVEAVTALADIGSPSALQTLERAMDDADREVRVAAFRAIGTRKHAGALPRLLDALRRKEIRAADLGEKTALFEAFGGMCGDAGVGELDAILNARGLLGAKEPPEMRACAARALGLVGTRAALAALQKAADAKDVVVRSAVARALRGGT